MKLFLTFMVFTVTGLIIQEVIGVTVVVKFIEVYKLICGDTASEKILVRYHTPTTFSF